MTDTQRIDLLIVALVAAGFILPTELVPAEATGYAAAADAPTHDAPAAAGEAV